MDYDPWMYYLVKAHHANYFHKFICMTQGMALLITGYIWSWYIVKILLKAIPSLFGRQRKITDASSDTNTNKQGVKHSKKEN